MPFELNVISVGQENVTKFKDNLKIKIYNEIDGENSRYFEIWPFMCQTKGIWYTLGVVYRGFFNAVPICETDFDIDTNCLPIPQWITDKSIIDSQLTPLIIKELYMKEFKEILEVLINESPRKTIMFHSRYQCPDYEIIQGVISLNDFLSQLESHKILFNVCYIISV